MIGGPRLAIYSAWANRRVPAYQTSCPKPWDNQAVRNQKLLENNLGGKIGFVDGEPIFNL
jgi:hypothetical protein